MFKLEILRLEYIERLAGAYSPISVRVTIASG